MFDNGIIEVGKVGGKLAKYELVKFPQVELKGSEERQWLDKAFAPLINYLTEEMPVVKDEIISTVMYMGTNGGYGNDKFYYKNSLTRSYIVFDQLGRIVNKEADALYFM